MKIKTVSITVVKGKAFLPTLAQAESGFFVDFDPVIVTSLKKDDLLAAIERMLRQGHPQVPDPTREQFQYHERVLLKATGTRSWKELARIGAAYDITWVESRVQVVAHRLDRQGRWEPDPERTFTFDPTTSLFDILEPIMEDIRSRPELLTR